MRDLPCHAFTSLHINYEPMKLHIAGAIIFFFLLSCDTNVSQDQQETPHADIAIAGTWKLISATIIENGDTTVTDYTRGKEAIKMLNDTHFSFFQHDLTKGSDSSAVFAAGGGSYTLTGNRYTEHLEYCSYRPWEDHKFEFEVAIKGDTLIQSGLEKIAELNVDRLNTETYVRIKN